MFIMRTQKQNLAPLVMITDEQFSKLKLKLLAFGKIELIILSSSMEPVIQIKDVVTVKPFRKKIKNFDIVAFYLYEQICVHIYLEILFLNTKSVFKTYSYRTVDVDPAIQQASILGEVVSHRLNLAQKISFMFRIAFR